MIHALSMLVLLVFPVLVIAAGLKDLTSYTIPNWMSLALLAAFPVAALAAGLPLSAMGANAIVGAIALVGGMAMFAAGWIGGGDAKLFGAAALWLGWPAVLTYLLVTGVAGGALAVLLLGLRSARLRPFVPSGPGWFSRLAEPGENVPYGVAIAIGALTAFPISALAAAH
jgi:prepilin peptidase CpaA